MKITVVCLLAITVLAAPCVYDLASDEPSPLFGLVAAATHTSKQFFDSYAAASELLF
jgi:hypothetical protein